MRTIVMEGLSLERVLVVEKSQSVREVICEMVNDEGYQCVCASSASIAYQLIPTLPTLRALVIDVDPGGIASASAIARFGREVAPNLSVVFISGTHTAQDPPVGDVPRSVFLSKPFTEEQLRRALSGGQVG
jgi:CheY-like chemotaxis protein